jgi:hypothetical protein
VGKPFLFGVPDLAGGLNESAAANIQDNESSVLTNMYVDGPSVFSRPGRTLVAGAYSAAILGIAKYRPSFVPTEYTILGCSGSLAFVDGAGITAIPNIDGVIHATLSTRWRFRAYGDELFALQRGNGGIKRLYGLTAMEAGIPAPATAPSVIDGGSGKKTAGVYRVAFRYLNATTGARSNWSPLSAPITLAELHRIAASGISTSSNKQVTAREIGCTKPDEEVIYPTGTIHDNATTTYDENALAPDEYGDADVDENGAEITDYRNGLPPPLPYDLEVYKERLMVIDKEGLYWSEPGRMQGFKSTSFMPVKKAVGLIHWDQHGLVIGTEENAQILQGDTPNDWRMDLLSREHGCPAAGSLAVGDGHLFWYTGVNIVQSSGGAPQILPRSERIATTLGAIPEAQKSDVVGETIPSRGWYVLSVPQPGGRSLIVYDYKAGAFVGIFPAAPNAMARVLESAQSEKLLAAFDGDFNLYEYLTGTSDAGAAIACELRTKQFGMESQGGMKLTRRVNLLTPAISAMVTVRVYHDGVLVGTRSGVSLAANGWKRITVATAGTPGSLVQAGVVYTGTPQLRIDQIQIEGVDLRRRVACL